MHCVRLVILSSVLAVASGATRAAPAADTRYISDRLTVPLRSGPTNGHRILHRGLPAGTKLNVLESDPDSSYVRIRTERGTEGWLEGQYLDREPIARQKLSNAEARIRQLERSLEDQRTRVGDLVAGKGSAEADSQRLSQQVNSLTAELNELKTISAGAVAEHAENQKLNAMNKRLRSEVQVLANERDRLEARSEQRVLLYGAGLIIVGLLMGVVIKSRPRRSAWT
ncbi:MAG: TIGR04211 family SH3 domain-containing protein [Pseudomonadota bacterium]